VATSSPETAAASDRLAPLRATIPLVGALAAVAAGARAGLQFEAVLAAAFVAVLAAISWVDLEERRVPNVLVLPATAVALLAQGLLPTDRFLESVLAGLGAALFFFVAQLISRNSVGMGDVKLALLIGVVLGQDVVGALFVVSIAAALVGLVMMARDGAGARKRAIPFAPFLALGAVVGLLIGDPAIYA
jgi:prepilin signal peptidase PulO-like enzyme (type II secretory pathway)